MRNTTGRIAVGSVVVATLAAIFSTQAGAQEKIWKHGLINAKADAGIFLMVSTRLCEKTGPENRDFAVQGRPTCLEGADCRRAR